MLKLAIASILLATAATIPSAIAGPNLPPSEQASSMVEQAQYWDIRRCRAWRSECADRQGWGSRGFHRCLERHGCERHRYGDRWDR